MNNYALELSISIENQESASLTEKLIRMVATKTSVKDLSLTILPYGASLHLPDEILSELHLVGVHISDEVLHDILLSCSLLEKIKLLYFSKGLNTIKVKNLVCLHELQIVTMDTGSTGFEISHVPSLHVMGCNVHMNGMSRRFGPLIKDHSISLGSNVTDLTLGGGVIRDNASLDMIIKLGLPFLKV
uniref:Uncharacterized protein n=1 Tax=Lactuca sativa TaxID=4236 RepID=A0A9R1VM50_LACSA|nr:hypothetical protein LSAT_V11C400197410 [Lactuca sativa]